MIGMLSNLLLFCAITLMLLAGAGLLHLLPRMGKAGKQLSEACCRVPLLDLIVCYFTVVPLLIGPLVSGWNGVLTALLSQVTMLLIWQWIHEAVHGEARRGPRIIKVLKTKIRHSAPAHCRLYHGVGHPSVLVRAARRIDHLSSVGVVDQLASLQLGRVDHCLASKI
jgi:hypothetical protein